jgi:UMF1 family MFS transporter
LKARPFGAGATTLFFFITAPLVVWGGLLFIIANLSFGAAIVFYNAFLPEIAGPDERDAVSSRGFGFGYLGGGVLLLLNLILFQTMADKGLAVRISLASAGLWWLAFTFLFPQQRLVQRAAARQLPPGETYLSHSLKQLGQTFRELLQDHPVTLRYLIAYLIYNDGIQTVIVVATQFGSEELGIGTDTLTLVILMIQFVAFLGVFIFNALAKKIGTKKTIMVNLVVWAAVVIYAWGVLYSSVQFWVLGATVALILGGSQALSRSLFSQMVPAQREAEYFSLYEISERGTSWIGPLVFALAVQITGTQRIALVSLIIFFIVGLILLSVTDVRQAIREAGNKVPATV